MDNNRRRKISELMDHLNQQRNQIESTGRYRVDPDLRKVYQWINAKIQDLHLEVFVAEYDDFEKRIEHIFDAPPSFVTDRDECHAVS